MNTPTEQKKQKKTKIWRALGAFANNQVGAALYQTAGPVVNAVMGRTTTPRLEQIPWAPFQGKLADCRVALVSTAGFHLDHDTPFDVDAAAGDPTFREIPVDVDPAELVISHTHYPHRYARQDPNVLMPLERLRELRDEGVFQLTPRCFSFGFAGTLTGAIQDESRGTAHEVARRLQEDQADILLLAPA